MNPSNIAICTGFSRCKGKQHHSSCLITTQKTMPKYNPIEKAVFKAMKALAKKQETEFFEAKHPLKIRSLWKWYYFWHPGFWRARKTAKLVQAFYDETLKNKKSRAKFLKSIEKGVTDQLIYGTGYILPPKK